MPLITLALIAAAAAASKGNAEEVGESDDSSSSSDAWTRYDERMEYWGGLFGVEMEILKAIAMNESSLGAAKSVELGFREPSNVEGSKSSDGKSWGLMQVTLTTARDFDASATPQKLNDPDYSIRLAAQLMARNKKYFSESHPRFLELWVKAYNQGAGNSIKNRDGVSTNQSEANKAGVLEYWARFQRNYQKAKAG